MPERSPRGAPALAPSPLAAEARSCRDATRDGALEHDAGVMHLFYACGHVEDESAVADVDIARHFLRHPIVTSDEEGTDGLVVLERHQPVRVLRSRFGLPELGELPMPGRIRDFHGELVGELALAVFRVPRASDRPGLRVFGARDDADADAPRCDVRGSRAVDSGD